MKEKASTTRKELEKGNCIVGQSRLEDAQTGQEERNKQWITQDKSSKAWK